MGPAVVGVRDFCIPNDARTGTWIRGKTCGPDISIKDGGLGKCVYEFSISLYQRNSLVGDGEGKCFHRFSIDQSCVGESVDCGDSLADTVCVGGLETRSLVSLSRLYDLFMCDGEVSLETGPYFFCCWFSFPNFAIAVKHACGKNNIVCCVNHLNRGERGINDDGELNGVLDLVKECFDG